MVKDLDQMAKNLDFRMENAQRLRFRVKVPDPDAAILHEGCVSIVIGSKE